MEAPTGQTEVTTDQADGQINLLRTTKRGHLEDLTLKGTTRQHLYNAYSVKAPTPYCPHRASLTALQVFIQESNDTRDVTMLDKKEDQDNPRMGALKFLSALQRKVDPKEIIEKELMFVDVTINSRPSKSTLIDSEATHNFIADQEARRLGLTTGKDPGKMKAVNSEALPIVGVSKRVPFKLGAWTGELNHVVVRMDDFDVVLGMEFLLEHKVIPMPLVKCLLITDRNPM